MRVALVSCVKSKRSSPAPAKDLYTSPLFRLLRRYAEANADSWFILSAEHGLVGPNQILAPYEKTLNKARKDERIEWARKVQSSLEDHLPPGADVIVLAGARYREHLVPFLQSRGHRVTVPLEGLPFGRQLQYLRALDRSPG
jgi:hypothetical protein